MSFCRAHDQGAHACHPSQQDKNKQTNKHKRTGSPTVPPLYLSPLPGQEIEDGIPAASFVSRPAGHACRFRVLHDCHLCGRVPRAMTKARDRSSVAGPVDRQAPIQTRMLSGAVSDRGIFRHAALVSIRTRMFPFPSGKQSGSTARASSFGRCRVRSHTFSKRGATLNYRMGECAGTASEFNVILGSHCPWYTDRVYRTIVILLATYTILYDLKSWSLRTRMGSIAALVLVTLVARHRATNRSTTACQRLKESRRRLWLEGN